MADRGDHVMAGSPPRNSAAATLCHDDGEASVLPDMLQRQAHIRPGAVAIEFEGRVTTYAELHGRAERVARALLAAGLQPGDRVSTLMGSADEAFALLFGAVRARNCFAPLNIRLAPLEIGKIIDDARPAILFVSETFADLAQQSLQHSAARPRLVILQGPSDAVFRSAASATATLPTCEPADDVLQLYTSGTTGLPKGVRHTNRAYSAMFGLRDRVPEFAYGPDDVVLDVMPLFHIAGLNTGLLAFAGGARLVLLPEFSPQEVLATIAQRGVTKTLFAPVMIQRLLDAPELAQTRLTSLRLVCYGASPISETVLAMARAKFGCGFMQLYGMTELAGAATALAPADHDLPGRLKSCGRPWPGIDVRVVNSSGRVLGPRAVGEIVIRGPLVTDGYFDRPDATAEAIRNGWLHSGDAGYFDEDGFLFVHDRVKDLIVSGGENIYPAEVENALAGCPGVSDLAVIGTPSEAWGEQVTALVVPSPGSILAPEALRDWATGRIAAYKLPKRVEVVDAIPRNASGKILRRQLRELFWSEGERQVG